MLKGCLENIDIPHNIPLSLLSYKVKINLIFHDILGMFRGRIRLLFSKGSTIILVRLTKLWRTSKSKF